MRVLRWIGFALLGLLVVVAATDVRPDIPTEVLRAKYANPDSRFAPVGGLTVHYRDRGRGPAVVLLHGSNASLHTWEPWVAGLREHYRTITLDLPGHGLTGPWPPGSPNGYEPDDLAAFVQAFTQALGVEHFTLVGNSMGGRIAWHFALAHPERLEGLVLVDAGAYPPTGPPPLGFRLLRNPVGRFLSPWLAPRRVYEQTLRASYTDVSKITPELIDRYWELNRRPGNRVATAARFALPVADPEAARIPTIKTPTLILWGRDDRLVPLELGERLHREIAGSTLHVYDGVGHIPQEEAPERSLPDVLAFLAGSPPADR